ncbi:MAG TPA: MarR family transcriptional regulator [Chloroflexota bacterium]|nr:MarR family transcriptional regulator [Chloroflexota bacterium]
MENCGPFELEQLSLHELMPFWGMLISWVGMEPVYREMMEAGLTESEHMVLLRLRRGACSVADVGVCLFISHSAASRAVDRLVRDGYVYREENPSDRRQKVVTLTQEGEALAGSLEAIMASGVETLLAPLDEEEREQARRLLIRMISAQLPRLESLRGLMAGRDLTLTASARSGTNPLVDRVSAL